MSTEKKRKRLEKLRNKYRLIIYNDNSFEEVYSFRLNRLNVFILVSVLSVILMLMVYFLIAYTPLKAYVIPDFPKAEERLGIIDNALRTDSIENELRMQMQYIENIRVILSGKEPVEIQSFDSARRYDNLQFVPSHQDSLLRREIEDMESENVVYFEEGPKDDALKDMSFYTPIHGFVTNSFNISGKHFGTDIAASNKEVVHAVHDGVVVMANWTIETGFVIYIQHDNNLVSGYKHNSKLLKKVGDKVVGGEAIALLGNTGEMTTGPHLHFELWHNGEAVNSEKYIVY